MRGQAPSAPLVGFGSVRPFAVQQVGTPGSASSPSPTASSSSSSATVSACVVSSSKAETRVVLAKCRFPMQGADLVAKRLAEKPLPIVLGQCFHLEHRVVHLSRGSAVKVLCGKLNLVVNGKIVPEIVFVSGEDAFGPESESVAWCRSCFGRCLDKVRLGPPRVGSSEGKPLVSDSSSSTGSSSSSSESCSD